MSFFTRRYYRFENSYFCLKPNDEGAVTLYYVIRSFVVSLLNKGMIPSMSVFIAFSLFNLALCLLMKESKMIQTG